MTDAFLTVRVQATRFEAEGILSFELQRPDGGELPPFTAGAHLDIEIPGDLRRSYSLVNAQDERHRYVIAVNRDTSSRGGSAYLCDTVRTGALITIAPPRNHFVLDETAPLSVMIAGGIGITPLWSMVQRLERLERPWRLYYAARSRAAAAFATDIARFAATDPGRLTMAFGEPDQPRLDLSALIAAAPHGAHFYCCGPARMIEAFETAARARPAETLHVERFANETGAAKGGFEVTLARSKRTLAIPAGKSILDVLLAEGFRVPRSCMEGVCGTCETPVLEGIPDHRDAVLSKRERASNTKMMICCSGALTPRLVLDL